MSQNYKVSMKMEWEFIVTANNKEETMIKIEEHLDVLLNREEGYIDWVSKAKEDIKNSDYSIEEYDGFLIS